MQTSLCLKIHNFNTTFIKIIYKKMVEKKFNNKLFLFILIGLAVILVISGFVYAYGGNNALIMGHSGGEINVTVNSVSKSLQSAIDAGDLISSSSFGPVLRARCPRFTPDDGDDVRWGRSSFPNSFLNYDNFLTPQGLYINNKYAPSGKYDFLYYVSCTENSDKTITFDKPYSIELGAAQLEFVNSP